MRTLIDGSCLLSRTPTGVSIAASDLLASGKIPFEGEAIIATYGWQTPDQTRKDCFPYPWQHHKFPSKVVHALCGSGLSSFDRLFGPADRLFFPNLNIVGTPQLPYDLLIHDISFLLLPAWFTWKSRAWHALARPKHLIQNAERVFVVSHWSKQDLVERLAIPERRITILDITPRKLTPSLHTRPLAEPYFLLLSAHDARKNALCAIRAFESFVKEHPTYKLVLVGARGVSSHPSIIHLPYLDSTERLRWLQHAQALLYPSWYEGFGLPPHEAQQLGVPTLAAGGGVIAETAPAGTVLLPAHTPHAWAEAMHRLV